MVTSWNWVYLSDFAPFKPVYIPEDDPSHFSFYFDTSQRRCCYVAPERFLAGGETKQGGLSEKMDIFSLGCVIAELFLEGTPTFTLAQLFKYKKQEYQPPLDSIEDIEIRSLVKSMISLNPEHRHTAQQYLDEFRGKAFPEYFYSFLHKYIENIIRPIETNDFTTTDRAKQLESDQRIETIWKDYGMITKELGFSYPSEKKDNVEDSEHGSGLVEHSNSTASILPVCLDLPGMNHWVPKMRKLSAAAEDDGALMIVALVCSAIRNTSRASARTKGCELLLALGERVHDEAKLDRCLPHLVSLLDDPSEHVQVAALRSLTHLLELVGAITPVNGNIFPEYIFPRLSTLLNNKDHLVRCAYAACLSSLAQTASRFLDMGQVLKTTGMLEAADPETENGISTEVTAYDTLKQNLSVLIEEHAIALLTDSNSAVRRALLRHITPLCIFFGKQKTNDIILSHLITYLNDKDPFLRSDFFDCVVGLAPFVGVVSMDQYIIPLMIQTLADPVEYVVEKVLQAFSSLAELGVIRASPRLWELLKVSAKFTIHPNSWIRNACVTFFAASARWMSPAQLYCMHMPIIRPFLECEINDFSEANILRNLKNPMSRPVYNRTLTWAAKAQKSIFWRIDKSSVSSSKYVKSGGKSAEDEQWLSRLYEIGLKEQDMWMLNVYKEYIYRVARLNHQLQTTTSSSLSTTDEDNSGVVKIQSIGILPKNVFFERSGDIYSGGGKEDGKDDSAAAGAARVPASTPATTTETQLAHARNQSSPNVLGSSPQPRELSEATRLMNIRLDDESNMTTPTSDHVNETNSTSVMAPAVTGATVTAEVYGEVGQQSKQQHTPSTYSPMGQSSTPDPNNSNKTLNSKAFRKSSSYLGDDPYIWRLLESMYSESMETDEPSQLGPKCNKYIRPSGSAASSPKRRRGKPLGILVSSFEEHTAAINGVVVSPDHLFFVTGSDDCTIKVWDCYRLEKNVINKSVQTMNFDSPVKHLTFIDNTYTVAVATADGFVKLVRIDMSVRTESLGPRYKKLIIVNQNEKLFDNEHVTWMEYVKVDGASLLYASTTRNRILAYNLKTMTIVQEMITPFSHGLLTCFVVDRRKNWLLIGTLSGILDLWDLRFGILVKSWGLPGNRVIHRITLYPKSDKLVCVSGGTDIPEVTVWDVETAQCKEIYRGVTSSGADIAMYTAQPVEKNVENQLMQESNSSLDNAILKSSSDRHSDILAMLTGVEFEQGSSTGRKGYMITGGADRMLRFWDLHTGEASSIISGLNSEQGSHNKKGMYTTLHPDNNSKIVVEKLISTVQQKHGRPTAGAGNENGSFSRPERLPRSTVISVDQLDLGRNHSAAITDVALLLRPYEMVISVDRSGVIKVYL